MSGRISKVFNIVFIMSSDCCSGIW